jgi:flagellar hook capping protein FlgD
VTTRATLVLAALFVATVCAVVVTQRVKDRPAILRRVHVTPVFTPNGDNYRDRATVRFRVGRTDRVSVAVLDSRGKVVRRLARGRRARPCCVVRLRWNGRARGGGLAPVGLYTVQVALRRQAKTIDLLQEIRLRRRTPHGRAVSR